MRARGFTLVEVMVALAIVALALPALLVNLYQQADNTAYLRDKTIAQMVAANKLTEIRLAVAATRELDETRENGDAEVAGRKWNWNVEIAPAPGVPNFYRVDVRVGLEEQAEADRQAWLYELAAFMSADLQIDASVSPDDETRAGDAEEPDTEENRTPDDNRRNNNRNDNNNDNSDGDGNTGANEGQQQDEGDAR